MLPKDPMILLSYINTQLRDFYPSLEELCRTMDIEEAEIKSQLAKIDYIYNAAKNQFI